MSNGGGGAVTRQTVRGGWGAEANSKRAVNAGVQLSSVVHRRKDMKSRDVRHYQTKEVCYWTGIYAISEIKQLGFFIGPVLTTYFIQTYSVTIMYWIVALTCIFEIFLAFIY